MIGQRCHSKNNERNLYHIRLKTVYERGYQEKP
jgi:hypothetical protein